MRILPSVLLTLFLPLLGCGHKQTNVKIPPPPENPPRQTAASKPPSIEADADATLATSLPPVAASPSGKPLYTQLGIASWYGAPYHNRRASNGEPYDMNQ